MVVGLLTEEQKNLLNNKAYAYSCKFNPIQDADDNWVISQEEIETNIYSKYNFLDSIPMIEYKPVIVELL